MVVRIYSRILLAGQLCFHQRTQIIKLEIKRNGNSESTMSLNRLTDHCIWLIMDTVPEPSLLKHPSPTRRAVIKGNQQASCGLSASHSNVESWLVLCPKASWISTNTCANIQEPIFVTGLLRCRFARGAATKANELHAFKQQACPYAVPLLLRTASSWQYYKQRNVHVELFYRPGAFLRSRAQ